MPSVHWCTRPSREKIKSGQEEKDEKTRRSKRSQKNCGADWN